MIVELKVELKKGKKLYVLRYGHGAEVSTLQYSIKESNFPSLQKKIFLLDFLSLSFHIFILFFSLFFQESKTPAKFWCVITFFLEILVTSVVLAASQKSPEVFDSTAVDVFLILALVDFILQLYFLWVIIVFVKEIIDMPGL